MKKFKNGTSHHKASSQAVFFDHGIENAKQNSLNI